MSGSGSGFRTAAIYAYNAAYHVGITYIEPLHRLVCKLCNTCKYL